MKDAILPIVFSTKLYSSVSTTIGVCLQIQINDLLFKFFDIFITLVRHSETFSF